MSLGREKRLDREWGRGTVAKLSFAREEVKKKKRPVCVQYKDRNLYYKDKYLWIMARRLKVPARIRNRCKHCPNGRAIKNETWCISCRDKQHRKVLSEMTNRVWLSEPEKQYVNRLIDLWGMSGEFKKC